MKQKIQHYLAVSLITAILGIAGCASQSFRFTDSEPVRYFNDIHPIPSPKSLHYNRFDYYANVLPTLPEVRRLEVPRNQNARDVNSMDEVPASSWYIPRLGYDPITPEELLAGPTEFGPPHPPVTIIRVRRPKSNPRFFVYDSRHIYYLLKFDPPDYPNIGTTTSFIVNRLFWGFGYHVPEDHLFYFNRNELKVASESNLTQQDINAILSRVALPINGEYRSISSRILEGLPLGPTPEKGVRRDDPNDLFPHEDRRVLRGLRVFAALTNMSDISSDNTLDIYVGEEGQGYIKHHLIDFDDAFGTHAARHKRLWAGYNHIFSIKDILRNLIYAGVIVEDWEKIVNTPWKSVGSFEAVHFKPENWKETHPFEPIRRSLPADNYWAAKIVGALTQQHFKALVDAAEYPEPEARKYMVETLMERRRKILKYYIEQVSPVEVFKYADGQLHLKDMGRILLDENFNNSLYVVQFYNDAGKKISEDIQITSESHFFSISISDSLMNKANGYLRIHVSVKRQNRSASKAAQFHLRRSNDAIVRLVGLVH